MVPRLLLAAGLLFVCLADDTKSSAVDDNPSAVEDNPSTPPSSASLTVIELSKDPQPADFPCIPRLLCLPSFIFWILTCIRCVVYYLADLIALLAARSQFFLVWVMRSPPSTPIPWKRFLVCIFIFVNQLTLAYFIISKMSAMYVNPSDSDLYVPSFLLRAAHWIAEVVAKETADRLARMTHIELLGHFCAHAFVQWERYMDGRARGQQHEAIVNGNVEGG